MKNQIANEYGTWNTTFSKKLGSQCQCDGNCRCGKVVNGRLDCSNCGWSGPDSYNALTGKATCPGCKTENCNKPNNNEMNNYTDPSGESPFSQGVVGTGIGADGFLLWSQDPLGNQGKNTESSFDQNTVAYAIGEQGMSLQPFSNNPISSSESGFDQNTVAYAIGEQGMALSPFARRQAEESGLFGDKVRGAFVRFTPAGMVVRNSFANKYCKSLGYMRSADKNGFKKCKAATKINYVKAVKGQWKYPAAPEGIEDSISPEDLAAQANSEVKSLSPKDLDAAVNKASTQDSADANALKTPETKSKTWIWIVVGVVVLVVVAGVIIYVKRKNKA
jgi:hypothetical protein